MIPINFHDSEPELVSMQFRPLISPEDADVIATERLAMILDRDRELSREMDTMFFAKGNQ